MAEELFREAYARLNTEQKKAVDTVEGPVMVIAGPGTGKTQILTLRIANILIKTDTQPEQILALTFTESGARAMRERLRTYIGARAYRIPVFTFHGFAEMLIRTYPDAFPRIIGGRAASDVDVVRCIETILEDTAVKRLRPMGDPTYYVQPIIKALATLKQEYITPDNLAEQIAEDEAALVATPQYHEKGAHKGKERSEYRKKFESIEKNNELLYVYRAYESMLVAESLYDFNDMITEAVHVLETNEDVLRDLQETYQYILADEHQDVNGSQNRILELLASYHDSPNLFVVGDEKQAIFRFQGASLENFLYFSEVFVGTKTIALTDNYRSGQTILDAAHKLIQVDEGPLKDLRIGLTADKKNPSTVELRTFSHEMLENDAVVRNVGVLIEGGVSPSDIAIILRTNREVEAFAARLHAAGIRAEASAESNILEHPLMRGVGDLIDVVVDPSSEPALFRLLHHAHWGISVPDLAAVLSARSYDTPLIKVVGDAVALQELGVKEPSPFTRIVSVIESTRKREDTDAPQRVVEFLLTESECLTAALAHDPVESGVLLRRVYDEIELMVRNEGVRTLRDVRDAFLLRTKHRIPLTAPAVRISRNAVSVMTAHKAKGLEYAHVFIPHLTDNAWGGRQRAALFSIRIARHLDQKLIDPLDDERRLLYVAMTRAKTGLYMSSSSLDGEGREMLPSRLLEDIDEAYMSRIDTKKEEEQFVPIRSRAVDGAPLIDTEFLIHVLTERGMSATALNNYLKSPWNYFYRNVLRIPETQSLTLQFGTVIHSVLETVTKQYGKTNTISPDAEIKLLLERALGKLPISITEYTRLHERGLKALLAYIPWMAPTLPVTTKAEYSLKVPLKTGDPDFPEILLTGKFDRLDFNTDGTLTRVVDYKTGKPKTRGYIEGTTKDSTGDYKRQLTFYALILSLHDDPRYRAREGVLSFVEPDTKGVIQEVSYTITDDEIEALKVDIVRVAHEIAHGAFLHAPCDATVCDYCDLVALLRRE